VTRAERTRWLWLAIWASIAGVGLARSLVTSLHPPNGGDLRLVVVWADDWLRSATSAYTRASSRSDYPPHALVFLSPLALVPPRWLPLVWSVFNVAIAPLCGALAIRLAVPHAWRRSRSAASAPGSAACCWACRW
jgi:hypothetical protein